MSPLHASCVEFEGIGMVLRGPSGAGKSDLALRLIDAGAALVGDDQIMLETRDRRLIARPAEGLAGLIEVRGLGIVELSYRAETVVGLVVDLVPRERIDRLPDEAHVLIEGVAVRALRLAPFEGSAMAKLRLAARVLGGRSRLVDALPPPRLARRFA